MFTGKCMEWVLELLRIFTAPAVLFVGAGVGFVWVYRQEIRDLFSRITKLPFGIEISLSRLENTNLAGSIPKGTDIVDVWEKAQTGNMEAQLQLGLAYDFGIGVKKNPSEALKWYRRSADQGYSEAQYNLGLSYELGDSVEQDDTEAMKWYQRAAGQGHTKAQLNLGNCYYKSQDYARAVKWYRRAADQGYATAQYNLGFSYDKGNGVPKDYAQAVEWYERAAKQGSDGAQHELGKKYAEGQGVSQSWKEAYIWSSIAMASGVWPAAKYRDAAVKELSSEDLVSAREEAERRQDEIEVDSSEN